MVTLHWTDQKGINSQWMSMLLLPHGKPRIKGSCRWIQAGLLGQRNCAWSAAGGPMTWGQGACQAPWLGGNALCICSEYLSLLVSPLASFGDGIEDQENISAPLNNFPLLNFYVRTKWQARRASLEPPFTLTTQKLYHGAQYLFSTHQVPTSLITAPPPWTPINSIMMHSICGSTQQVLP